MVALPVTFTVIYLLMAGALLPISIPYSSKTTTAIGGLGALEALYLGRLGTRLAFREEFYGHSRNGHVDYGWLQLCLFSVMFALSVVALREEAG